MAVSRYLRNVRFSGQRCHATFAFAGASLVWRLNSIGSVDL